MPDVERLNAEAEDAQIRSEMARSRLAAAKSNVHKLGLRWSEAKHRRSMARSVRAAERSGRGPTGT